MSPLTIGEHAAVRAVVAQSRVAGRAALVAALDRIRPESPPIPEKGGPECPSSPPSG